MIGLSTWWTPRRRALEVFRDPIQIRKIFLSCLKPAVDLFSAEVSMVNGCKQWINISCLRGNFRKWDPDIFKWRCSKNGGVLKMEVLPKSKIYPWILWNKPSSYWGTPNDCGNHHCCSLFGMRWNHQRVGTNSEIWMVKICAIISWEFQDPIDGGTVPYKSIFCGYISLN